MDFFKGIAILLAIATLSACVSHPSLEHPDYMVPALEPLAELSQEERGSSLYSPITEVALFEDVKGYRRGDIINVLLAERTAAQKSSGTNVSKSNEATIQNPTLGGAEREQLGTIWGRPFNLGFGLDSEQSFTGASGSNQSNTLSGSIAVTVVEELPRGNLLVQGEKWISLNEGHEFIRVRGIVRRSDITQANTVLSTQIADARIAYGGSGATKDANRMGWMSRFFNSALQPF
jgi:flagellar L-ring protein precursor FlgH